MSSPPDRPAPELDVTVVIPVFDEEPTVLPLAEALHRVLGASPWSYELLFVDDGSDDGSFDRMREAAKASPQVRAIGLRRNFGKAAALCAGFDGCRGRVGRRSYRFRRHQSRGTGQC